MNAITNGSATGMAGGSPGGQATSVPGDVSEALLAAFNAGYDVGRSDGARYDIRSMVDMPDRATRRSEWISRMVR